MATQKGIFKFSGKLGELIFYKRKKKHIVRQAHGGKTYHLSEGSKQSGQDFGTASKNAAYIRKAFAPLIKQYADGEIINRLNKRLVEILNTASEAKRGHKKLIDGNLALLAGFEFNISTPLGQLLYQAPSISVAENGILTFEITEKPLESIFNLTIPNAVEVCLKLMAFVFDLEGEAYETFSINELRVPIGTPSLKANLSFDINIFGKRALIIAIGVHYRDEYGNINNQKYGGSQIVKALQLIDGIVIEHTPSTMPYLSKEKEEDGGLNWNVG